MIVKGSNEFELWKEIYGIRNRHAGQCNTEEEFKAVMYESAELYKKYQSTDAAIPAKWGSMMLREIFNNEWMIKHGGSNEKA